MTASTLERATIVDLLTDQADQIATDNPPSKVLATVVLALFTAIGWVIGRTWFYSAKSVAFIALAVRYGYRQGARVPVEVRKPAPAQ
jgi:hypothetical protein